MEVFAHLRNVNMSAQKCRLVADQIRGLPIEAAQNLLAFSPKKASYYLGKALNSAIANAENNNGADIDELRVTTVYVNEGPTLKRIRPRAKGRANRILKRSSHISIAVSDNEESK